MNIKEAKTQIKNAMTAYFTKDEFGNYVIPLEHQRPVILIGPPGIGKTAIMEQIAQEMGVGLVSYSMTHHTRQSALGLPFIIKKNYGGKEYDVSEYTMSEIIASVYDLMEDSGLKEGILFLDEINCVSETLAPAMLQFLQYKIFGRHRVPDGWIVVTAGNPPEYNNSVREFDIVTWDRLKRIDVEPDYDVWKEYAYHKGVHAAIITYLDIKKTDFYKVESTVDGKSFVTARGWSDISDMILLYEKNGLVVDESLTVQYLQDRKVAKEFAIYYDLFNKYKSDYQIDHILKGQVSQEIKARAKNADFDEKLSLLGLLISAITEETRLVCLTEQENVELLKALKEIRAGLSKPEISIIELLDSMITRNHQMIETGRKASSMGSDSIFLHNRLIAILEDLKTLIFKERPADANSAFTILKRDYDTRINALNKQAGKTGEKLSNSFHFCEEVFADGQELLILVTELTINHYCAQFISHYGCKEYFAHNKQLLFYERRKDIISEIENMDL